MVIANSARVKVFNILSSSLGFAKKGRQNSDGLSWGVPMPHLAETEIATNNLKASMGDGALIYIKRCFDLDQCSICDAVVGGAVFSKTLQQT